MDRFWMHEPDVVEDTWTKPPKKKLTFEEALKYLYDNKLGHFVKMIYNRIKYG